MTTTANFHDYETSYTETMTIVYCGNVHRWVVESLRGTNCNQRVEHVRCTACGRRETRVWLDLPAERRPTRIYEREGRSKVLEFAA